MFASIHPDVKRLGWAALVVGMLEAYAWVKGAALNEPGWFVVAVACTFLISRMQGLWAASSDE